MPIRVECTTEGLEANWIEVSEVWTRNEMRTFMTVKGDEFTALWERKVTGCNLVMVDGETITDPKQVNAKVDDLDLRLVHFVTNGPLEVYPYLLRLGEVNKRLSFDGVAEAARMTRTTTKKATPKKRR